MKNYLVCYTKGEDTQYHVFTDVPEHIEFVLDDLHKQFTDKGYLWSSVYFPIELAEKCMFTISKYEKGKLWQKSNQ